MPIARFRLSKALGLRSRPSCGKGHQLHVDVRRDAALHLEQGLDRQQAVVADVDVGADRQQAARHRPVAILQRALDQRLLGQLRFQFAPQRDPLQQGAGGVHARQAVAEGGVHVEVGVDEGRLTRSPPASISRAPLAASAGPTAAMVSPSMAISARLPSARAGIANHEIHGLFPFGAMQGL
jgi:hypothetical protein